jgi:phage tail protein X
MPSTYTTKQRETVDLICQRHYGRTRDVTEAVLSANPGIATLGAVLPFATVVLLPDIQAKRQQKRLVSLWD